MSPGGRRPAPTAEQAEQIARERFGWPRLRPGQRRALRSALDGRDVLVVMPTGGGKSAIYQITALLRPGPTVVVSPLIALQRDQLVSLLGIEGAAARTLDASHSATERESTLDALTAGEVEFLFITPEQLQRPELVRRLRAAGPSLLVVDEAHCVTAWGHDFRPDYLRLGSAAGALGRPPIIALTATASPPVRDEIARVLQLQDPDVVVEGFDRPNLDLQVQRYVDDDERRGEVMVRAASEVKPGLVYTSTRADTERYAAELASLGLRAAPYHAGLGAPVRRATHDAFLAGELDVVCATSAFGMGIDKPDVRFVLHAQLAASPEAYYQEIGRAGRDGAAATAVLFYREQDLGLRRYQASVLPREQDVAAALRTLQQRATTTPDLSRNSAMGRRRTGNVVNLLLEVGALDEDRDGRLRYIDDGDPGAVVTRALEAARARRRREQSRVDMMRGYAETRGCRRQFLLEYLGQRYQPPCGGGDSCRTRDTSVSARSAAGFAVQERVRHDVWGEGVVMSTDPDGSSGASASITVLFESVGYKTLSLSAVQSGSLLEAVG